MTSMTARPSSFTIHVAGDGLDHVVPLRVDLADTVAKVKKVVALYWNRAGGGELVQAEGPKLALTRLGVPLVDELTLYLCGLGPGCTLVVERLGAKPMPEFRAESSPDVRVVRFAVGATNFMGTESGITLADAATDMLEAAYGGGSVDTVKTIIQALGFAVADGASPPQKAGQHLESAKEEATGDENCVGVARVVCFVHIVHDGCLNVARSISVPCPVWKRSNNNSVIIYLLEQCSTVLHSHGKLVGLEGFSSTCPMGMETRWGSYVAVCAFLFVNRVVVQNRVTAYLQNKNTFTGGGGDIDAALRLVLWAVSDTAALIAFGVLAEFGRYVADVRETGASNSLQHVFSARARSGKSIQASRPLRDMIARPKISRNEWKMTER